MTKSELLAAIEEFPDDFNVMVDAIGLTDVDSAEVDHDAGMIIIIGA